MISRSLDVRRRDSKWIAFLCVKHVMYVESKSSFFLLLIEICNYKSYDLEGNSFIIYYFIYLFCFVRFLIEFKRKLFYFFCSFFLDTRKCIWNSEIKNRIETNISNEINFYDIRIKYTTLFYFYFNIISVKSEIFQKRKKFIILI